jgi:hypothetical protein
MGCELVIIGHSSSNLRVNDGQRSYFAMNIISYLTSDTTLHKKLISKPVGADGRDTIYRTVTTTR